MYPFLEEVRQALDLTQFDGVAAQARMKPVPRATVRPSDQGGAPRQGAVLLLLFHRDDQYRFVLTRRRDDLASQAPCRGDDVKKELRDTALRETYEEIGIEPEAVTVLGCLRSLYILPSDFEVTPFVGWHPDSPAFVPQPSEVAEIIEVPLVELLYEDTRREEVWERQGFSMVVPYFQIGSHKVWGATAMMLSEFVERLRTHSNGALTAIQ